MQQLDIVELIEKNPISKLSNVYNNKLLNKIKKATSTNIPETEKKVVKTDEEIWEDYERSLNAKLLRKSLKKK